MRTTDLNKTMWVVSWLLLAGLSWVHAAAQAQDSAKGQGPAIRFEEAEFDFGLLPPGKAATLTHEFVFRNTGDQPLKILSIGQSCRTDAQCPVKSLSAGASSTIRVNTILPAEYTTSEQFSRQISVQTNDPIHGSVELRTKARFAFSLKWEPALIDLGRFAPGQSGGTTVTVESRTDSPYKIKQCIWNKKLFAVEERNVAAGPGSVEASGAKGNAARAVPGQDRSPAASKPRKTQICMRVLPDAPEGSFVDILVLRTDRSDIPEIRIPVSGHVMRSLAVEPEEIFWGILREAKVVEKDIRIVTQDPNFLVIDAVCGVPGIQAQIHKEKSGYRVRVSFDPTRASGPIEGDLRIRTKSPSEGEIKIPIRGLVKIAAKATGK